MQAEARAIGNLRHVRLVNLIGYCCDGDERLLVSEYMPNQSLTKHLFHCMIIPQTFTFLSLLGPQVPEFFFAFIASNYRGETNHGVGYAIESCTLCS